VRELAAQDAPIRVAVAVTCRVLKIARQPYYRWLADPVTDAEWAAAHRAHALFLAHEDDPEFGYRLLADEARDAGQDLCDRTAWKVCSGLTSGAYSSASTSARNANGMPPRPPTTAGP